MLAKFSAVDGVVDTVDGMMREWIVARSHTKLSRCGRQMQRVFFCRLGVTTGRLRRRAHLDRFGYVHQPQIQPVAVSARHTHCRSVGGAGEVAMAASLPYTDHHHHRHRHDESLGHWRVARCRLLRLRLLLRCLLLVARA